MILLALACSGSGEDQALPTCASPVTEGWNIAWEQEVRLDTATASWEAGEGMSVRADTCDTSACVIAAGQGTVLTSMLLNRGVDYAFAGTVSADTSGSVELVQHLRSGGTTVLAEEAWTGPRAGPLTLGFRLAQPGEQVDLVFRLGAPGTLTLEGGTVTGPQWARAAASEGERLHLGFLVHVEASGAYETDGEKWGRRGQILEALAERLAAHGARLTVQPDASFVRAATTWDPGWFDRMEALGTDWSAHIHGEDDGVEGVEADARDARRAFEAAGREVSDFNGGFGLGPWDRVAAAGFTSLSAFKNEETQLGLVQGFTQPWRPADGTTSAGEAAFTTHDPEGPLVYLPGMAVREADHARFPDFGDRVLSQALSHTRADLVNGWYFLDHVDGYGPSDDEDALAAWLASGALEGELDLVERLYTEVLDPAVAAGRVSYASPAETAAAFFDWEAGCVQR